MSTVTPVGAVGVPCHFEFRLERLGRVGNAIERNQDLQHITVRLARRGKILLPRAGGLQGGIARTRLQGDIGGALVKLAVAGFAGGIEHQREAGGRLAVLRRDFAHQQLVKQGAVES